jgi:hypothetical protein
MFTGSERGLEEHLVLLHSETGTNLIDGSHLIDGTHQIVEEIGTATDKQFPLETSL